MSLDVRVWDCVVPPRQEWGSACIFAAGKDAMDRLRSDRRSVSEALDAFSIPCVAGAFVPLRSMRAWSDRHASAAASLEAAVSEIAREREGIVGLVRLAAANLHAEGWSMDHGDPPPPSGVQYAANLAASLVPSAADIRDSLRVVRAIGHHPYAYMSSDACRGVVGEAELRMAAWVVVDDLLAGKARRLKDWMETLVPSGNNWTARRSSRALGCLGVFIDTDLEPSVGLSELAEGVRRLLDGVAIEDIDASAVASAIVAATRRAEELSTVSGFLGAMG